MCRRDQGGGLGGHGPFPTCRPFGDPSTTKAQGTGGQSTTLGWLQGHPDLSGARPLSDPQAPTQWLIIHVALGPTVAKVFPLAPHSA